ncbi:hypothetical protein [Senegalia massiliensis]|uniref:Uncharacterized protein n=1 Tax=Senegalia massiliensis TaxID=1720316 RepID=A0A845QX56_9CLOT|nr:hypothetical protein [Senegalia massiliensis]NBI07527.1 hypothetical protein [Senegalia massiliensis]
MAQIIQLFDIISKWFVSHGATITIWGSIGILFLSMIAYMAWHFLSEIFKALGNVSKHYGRKSSNFIYRVFKVDNPDYNDDEDNGQT